MHLRIRLVPLALTAAVLIEGCGSDAVVSPVNGSATAFWALQLERSAVTMALAAPYDTLRLVATPRTASGAPIDNLPAVTFSTTNVNTVEVDSAGLLRAVGLTPGTKIIASLTADGVTHADTATVAVTPDPGALLITSFSIQPVPPDSARMALGGTLLEPNRTLTPIVTDAGGNQVFDLPIRYATLDETTAIIDRWGGAITGVSLGYVPLVATMTAYGRSFADTVQYRIGLPAYTKVHIHGPLYAYVRYEVGSFDPDSVTVGTGAVIEWEDAGRLPGTASDITFDAAQAAALDSVPEQFSCVNYATDCDGTGNVAPFGPAANDPTGELFWQNFSRARRFTLPGVYRYTNTISGTHGVVVVVDETAP
jgi:hypothetical protein